jgi:hypothetical protein
MVGTKYVPQQVNALFESLIQYRPDYQYHCYTDAIDVSMFDSRINIIPVISKPKLVGVWNKLAMFSNKFPIRGRIMYFDLDTLVVGNPFNVDIDWDKFTMVDCHWKPQSIIRSSNYDVTFNSSMLAWDTESEIVSQFWDHFIYSGQKDYFLRKYVGIDRYLKHEYFDKDDFAYFPHDYIQSYKYEQYKQAPVITFEELDFGSIDIESVAQTHRASI